MRKDEFYQKEEIDEWARKRNIDMALQHIRLNRCLGLSESQI